jgi:glycosyltransferase involved in cell wall biosynthesis
LKAIFGCSPEKNRFARLDPPACSGSMRVTLDVGPAVHQKAGLSRYAERLAAHILCNHGDKVDLTLFFNAHSGHGLPVELSSARHTSLPLGQRAWRLSALASQFVRVTAQDRLILRPGPGGRPQLFHGTEHLLPYLRVPAVLTVHDLIFVRYPQHHTLANRLFLSVGMPIFVRDANAIIAVSRQTRQDLVDIYRTPSHKVRVIYEGIDDQFAPTSPDEVTAVRARYSPDRPYLLMVGTLEPRKNHIVAMRALARLKALGCRHRLLIVGGEGWRFDPVRRQVDALGLTDDVRFAGFVPGTDLPALYTGADCLLQPSLYEGFGFPVLEAMACGTPVVCSASSSLSEVAGRAALQVQASDDEALSHAIYLVLDQPALAQSMREQGLARARGFSWDECTRRTVELYREVIDSWQ